jgi:squalene-hopene/tetraprenyl-beta-curcumene cyclase
MKCWHSGVVLAAILLPCACETAPAQEAKNDLTLLVNSPDEPVAKQMSLAKAADFLDHQSRAWTSTRKCGTCHTNYPYLLARGRLRGDLTALREVRGFFEGRVARWDSGNKDDRPRNDAEVVATASTLALQDALTTGRLHPLTRKALDRMWTVQQPAGAWEWLKCQWPPLEHDDYYGAAYAAVAVGHAPDNYAESAPARKGLEGLRRYFRANPPPSLHHKLLLLWASQKLPGLMSEKLQQSTVRELRALQRADGGWSLPALGDWVGKDERPNDRGAPSDGYATGLIVYVLRLAGVPARDEALRRGVAWLKGNQRESGAWFTRSINTDRYHFITHAGTAYAVLALKACE